MLVKVCCIQNLDEARRAIAAGASHLGLVGAMPSGPGPIGDEVIAEIAAGVRDEATPVLLTSASDAPGIVDHVSRTGVECVQIVRTVGADVRLAVKDALPRVAIIQVVHVQGPDSIEDAAGAAVGSEMVLLDSGRPGGAVEELGGTGRRHDWSLSARIVAELDVPVLLAGGLDPENVEEAIETVGPAGVDLCSGLRDERGDLEDVRLTRFMAGVRLAR